MRKTGMAAHHSVTPLTSNRKLSACQKTKLKEVDCIRLVHMSGADDEVQHDSWS